MRRSVATALAIVAIAGGAAYLWIHREPVGRFPVPGEKNRITVEVLNGTGIDGLARETTRRLRRAGIDVVYFGDAEAGGRVDSTRILVRRGDSAAALRVRASLGRGSIVVEPDAGLLLDLTVLLGADLAPPVRLDP